MLSDLQPPAISRTVQYKKITKPLLERKRRARINRCLDELKELMVDALEAEGENISKLEKADILELTVRHLHRLHKPRDPVIDAQKFQAGFGKCAQEACQFLLALPGVDTRVSHNLIKHLGAYANSTPLSIQVPNCSRSFSPPLSPLTPSTSKTTNYLSSTPSVQDLSKPMTGLLMRVPNKNIENNNNNNNRFNNGNNEIMNNRQNMKGVLRNVILERRKLAAIREQNNCNNNNFNNVNNSNNSDSDIEIDIENDDEKDDMWRPW